MFFFLGIFMDGFLVIEEFVIYLDFIVLDLGERKKKELFCILLNCIKYFSV